MKKILLGFLLLGMLLLLPFQSLTQSKGKIASPLMLGADIGLGIPTGDFADIVNAGFGLNGIFSYFLQNNLLITGNIGYWTFSKDEGEVEFSFNTIPLNGGLNYRFSSQSKFIPYIGAEALFFFNSYKSKYLSFSSSDSETKFGFVPLVGFAYKINPSLEFRGTLKYTIIFTESENTTFLGLLVGLHFPL